MESRALRYFTEVVRLASISRAAEKMRVSQPAISRSIRQLEERLCVKLLVRTPTGVVPTDAGRVLFARAQSITLEISRAEVEVGAFAGHQNAPVCVGVLRSQMWELMPAVADRLLRQHPDVRLRVIEQSRANLLTGLVRGEFDLIVSVARVDEAPANLVQQPLFNDRHTVIVRTGHPARDDTKSLSAYPWIVPPSGSERRLEINDVLRSLGIVQSPSTFIECDSNIFLRAMVRKTNCVGVMPCEPSAAEMDDAGLTMLPSTAPARRTVALLSRNDYPLSAKAACVASVICLTARQLQRSSSGSLTTV